MGLVEEMLARDPSLADQREELQESLELIEDVASLLPYQMASVKPIASSLIASVGTDPAEFQNVRLTFAQWGVSLEKLAKAWGLETEEDGIKLSLFMQRHSSPNQPVNKQARMAFLLAKIRPQQFNWLV
jgi:hypothetical protein